MGVLKLFSHRTCIFLIAVFFQMSVAALTAHAAGEPMAHKVFQWRPFLAPFHSVVLHFPIGFLAMACVLELYRMRWPSAEVKKVITLTLWLSLFSGGITAVFGILRATGGGYQTHSLESHRWTGIGVVVATLLTLALQRRAFREMSRPVLTGGYRGMLAVTLGLVATAGHMGGNLTHGSNYLTENAPMFVRELIEDSQSNLDATASANLGDAEQMFVESVQPILEKKCIRCHGAEKQRGDFRLDLPESALAGGESGKPAIKPGDPMGSELVRLVLLPPGDDAIMPPDGKEPLTADETLSIIRWIQKGAAFPAAAKQPSVRHASRN